MPDPSWPVLEVELDEMENRTLSDVVLEFAQEAYFDIEINLQFVRDEESIPELTLDGSVEQRRQLLSEHRTHEGMVHAVVATRRLDLPERGGELVASDGGPIEESGVLIFYDEIDDLHPACGSPNAPSISRGEALAGTLVHEIGHALQLGHDTEVGGGVNFYNIMSEPTGCGEAQKRSHGLGNHDGQLGATEELAAPRFSAAARALIDLDHVVSIDTAILDSQEM